MKLKKLPKLSKEETVALIESAQTGDETSLEKLVLHNAGLVLSVIRRIGMSIGQEEQDDLFQVGVIGLVKAIQKFDLNRGLLLSTYAVPKIYGEIRFHLRDRTKPYKVPRPISETANKIHLQKLYELTPQEIADKLGVDIATAKHSLTLIGEKVLSLDKPMKQGEDIVTLLDYLTDDSFSGIESAELRTAFRALTDCEVKVIKLRYYHDRTQTETARVVGVSQMQVSRIEKRAIKKLKEQFIEM